MNFLTSLLSDKRWHLVSAIATPALYAAADAAYTGISNGTITFSQTGLGASALVGLGILMQTIGSHKDSLNVQVPLAPPPAAAAAQSATLSDTVDELIRIVGALGPLRTALLALPAAEPTVIPPPPPPGPAVNVPLGGQLPPPPVVVVTPAAMPGATLTGTVTTNVPPPAGDTPPAAAAVPAGPSSPAGGGAATVSPPVVGTNA